MKHFWIALPLAALLCLPAGAAELTPLKYDKMELFGSGEEPISIVTADGKMGAVDVNGAEVVPVQYDQVYESDRGTFVVCRDGKWGLVRRGKVVIPLIYDSVDMYSYYNYGFIRVGLNGLYGLCDGEGDLVVPIQYQDLVPNSEDRIAFARDGKWGYLDWAGNEVIPAQYDEVYAFEKGVATVVLDGERVYIDPSGEQFLPGTDRWRQLSPTAALVNTGEAWVKVTTPETEGAPYEYVCDLGENFLGGKTPEGEYYLLDLSGEKVLPEPYDDLSEYVAYGTSTDYVETTRNGCMGIIGKNGVELFKPDAYEDIELLGSGLAVARREGLYCLLDQSGRELTEPVYEEIWDYTTQYTGLMAAKRDGKYAFLDRTGAEVIPPKYDELGGISTLKVKRDGEWFFLDADGRELPVPKRESLGFFEDGLARFQRDGKWGYISKEGVEVVPPKYDTADHFCAGYAAVQLGTQWGYIDVTGKEVVPPKYDGASALSQGRPGVGFVSKDQKYGLLELLRPACERTQTVTVDGEAAQLQAYALQDYRGYETNYVKLRDVAALLNGTAAQFSVEYDGETRLKRGKPYAPNGSEGASPFRGDQPCRYYEYYSLKVDGWSQNPTAILLTDENGGGYAYFKLRDLADLLNFRVAWDPRQGVCISTR